MQVQTRLFRLFLQMNESFNQFPPEQPKIRVIVECPILYETVDHDLDKYHSENNNTIYESVNGYKYFAIDGLTVTFFRPTYNNLQYHIVIGELNQNQLNDLGVLYDDLLKLKPIFTFIYKNNAQLCAAEV